MRIEFDADLLAAAQLSLEEITDALHSHDDGWAERVRAANGRVARVYAAIAMDARLPEALRPVFQAAADRFEELARTDAPLAAGGSGV